MAFRRCNAARSGTIDPHADEVQAIRKTEQGEEVPNSEPTLMLKDGRYLADRSEGRVSS
jgi:hypothetical protein